MNELIKSEGIKFIEPYPIEQLNGEKGLTSQDISHSLRITHSNVLKKIRNGKFKEDCKKMKNWNLNTFVFKSGKTGRPTVTWVLNTRAAKVFIARQITFFKTDSGLKTERIETRYKPLLKKGGD